MLIYFVRRLLYTIPILFGVALVVFSLFNLVGGDPTYQMLGKHATEQQIIDLRHELGLDQPKWKQFVDYLVQVATFDYGKSYSTKQKISEMIWQGVWPSLSLALPAFVITTLISVIISLLAAYYRKSWMDQFVVVACIIGMSMPTLAYILFGQYLLGYQLGWFPVSGYDPDLLLRIQYLIMPILIWTLVSMGIDVRFFRNAMLDETQQDYVRTARAKGLEEKWIFLKHILKNSMVPIVTYIVIEIPLLVLGAFLLESFFGIPGIGSITIDAINNSDLPVLKAMTTLTALLYIAGTIATDLIYTLVDPRVSLK